VTTRNEFTESVRQAVLDTTRAARIPAGYTDLVDRVITAVQDTCTLALDEAAEAIREKAESTNLSEGEVEQFLNTTILGTQQQAEAAPSGDQSAEIAALRETVARLSEFARANGFRG
jgi:hypothetical protein